MAGAAETATLKAAPRAAARSVSWVLFIVVAFKLGVLDLDDTALRRRRPSASAHRNMCGNRQTGRTARGMLQREVPHAGAETHPAHPRAAARLEPRRADPPGGYGRNARVLQRAGRGDPGPALRGDGRDARRRVEQDLRRPGRIPHAHRAGGSPDDAGALREEA